MKLSSIRAKSIQIVHQNRIKRQNLRVEFKLTWGESFVCGNIGTAVQQWQRIVRRVSFSRMVTVFID